MIRPSTVTRRRSPIARMVAAAVVLAAFAACGDDDGASTSAPSDTTGAVEDEASSITTSSSTTTTRPEPPPGYAPLAASGPVPAGPYAPATFDLPIAFTLGEGWSVLQELPKGVVLLRAPEPDDRALTFDVTVDSDTTEERVQFLSGLRGFTSGAIEDAMLFGLTGSTARVTADAALVSVPTLAEHYQVKQGDVIQIYALDADGTTLTVLVEASSADFDAFAAEARAVLDSVILPPW